jgi:hypothetical protein
MLKVAFAVLAVVLAGSASAAEWRSLRVDASSEAAYSTSMALFQDKLSPSRRHAFARALQEIWAEGMHKASAEQREFTPADYLAQLDGLKYDEVVTMSDPTGTKAKRYRAEYYAGRARGGFGPMPGQPGWVGWYPSDPPPVSAGAYRGLPQTANGY